MKQKLNGWRQAFGPAFLHTIPILSGFLALGITYGILMRAIGINFLWSSLMSAAAFCGSMQFVAVSMLNAQFDPLQMFLMAVMVNARHLFYGISTLEKYRGLGRAKAFLIFAMCDETFAIVSSVEPPPTVERKKFYILVSLLNYLYWIVATMIGGLLGSVVTMNLKGLDFVLTALFVVLFIEQIKSKQGLVSGLIGLLSTVAAVVIFGSGSPVIPSMLIIFIVFLIGGKIKCK